MPKKKGKFIVIDGTDGSGKGTQTKLLIKRLKKEGHKVKELDFPRYGDPSAYFVEEYLNGKYGSAEEVGPYCSSVFYAIDRYAASFEAHKWLKEGYVLISNRYVSANKGHQTGKIKSKKARDNYLTWLDELEYEVFEIPRPNKVFVLHVPSDIAQKLVDHKEARAYLKGKKRDIHEEDLNHLQKAEKAYLEMVDRYGYWKKISCMDEKRLMTIPEIHEMLYKEVKKILKKK